MEKNVIENAKQAVVKAIDANGNGEIDVEDVIILGMRVPGVRIDRDKFLRKEFENRHSEEVLNQIVEHNPTYAGISHEEVDKLAKDTINFERTCVSGISFALGVPGGWAMAATIPTDIAQYYGYTLRAAQKLMYLYGFPAIDLDDSSGAFDTATLNTLILCIGVMNGVAGANNAIKVMAKCFAVGVEKKLVKAALTKGTIYPIVKSVAKWFGANMTKEVFAGFFKKAIPVAGGVVGGALTFAMFKPCCDRLVKSLKKTAMYDPSILDADVDKEVEIIEATVVDEE